jgi:hypothetical protein
MPAGRFSEAERAPYYARALASVAQAQNDSALRRAALEHYADHCEARASERGGAPHVLAWISRARRARELAKEEH